jgi:heme transporter 1
MFGFMYRNPDTALWGLASGVFAAITLCVHIKYNRDQWVTGSNWLRALMLFGCLAQLASVCGFAVYLALAITEHQSVTAYGRAYYVSSVWAAMTWKWSFLLFLYSRNYRRLYEQRTGMCADIGYEKV